MESVEDMISFEKVDNPEVLEEYLESSASLLRDEAPIVYSHYTDIRSALNIFSTRTIWLNSYCHMNDLFEKELLDRSTKKGNFFFLSLSRANESLALYNMYGKKESSVVLRIPSVVFTTSIRKLLDSDYKGGIDDDSRSGSFVRKVDAICCHPKMWFIVIRMTIH